MIAREPAHATPWRTLGHLYDEVDSTMAVAQTLGAAGAPHGSWVLAKRQTAGRGRRGRTWQSEQACGVYMTLLLRPHQSLDLAGLPLVFGLAALRAVDAVCKARGTALLDGTLGLKWPNDVFADGKKLGGILVEAEGVGQAHPVVRVGVGLNVARYSQNPLSADVAARYVGLLDLLAPCEPANEAADLSREAQAGLVQRLAEALVDTSHAAYTAWATAGLGPTVAAWDAVDVLRGQRVTAQRGEARLTGVAQGIGPDGRLKLQTQDGVVWVDSGEVHVGEGPHSDLTQSGAAVYVGLT